MTNLATYTIPDEVYASFFHRTVGTITGEEESSPSALEPYSSTSDLLIVPVTSSISTTRDSASQAVVASSAGAPNTPFLDGTPVSVFQDIGEIQATGIPMSREAQGFPNFPTPTLQSSHIAVAQNPNDSPISPIAIIGLATGGAISVVVALAMAVLMCTRRRHSGRYRQNSVVGPGMKALAPMCIIEPSYGKEQVHELPSSLKASSSNSRTSSNRSRHITWKDQVFSDQSFMTLPPLTSHPASISMPLLPRNCLRAGEKAQESDSPGFMVYLPPRPNHRISYRSFSSPTLGADYASIYSSVPPSPVCVSALSPIPSYIFSPSHHLLQRQRIPSQRNSITPNSGELNDYYEEIASTSIYSFFHAPNRRSLSDSLAIQEVNSFNPLRKSLIRCSSNSQTLNCSFYSMKSPTLLAKPGNHFLQSQVGGNRFTVINDISDDSDSISSVSSTSSSILNYNVGGTPRKPFVGGLLAVDSSPPLSSGRVFDDSPLSSGLTFPPHQIRYLGGQSELQQSPFNNHTVDNPDSSQAPGSGIGVALSSPLLGATFIAASASEQVFQDDFLVTSNIDTYSPTLEEISTRHFSCSMSTCPRSGNTNPSPPLYPPVIPPGPDYSIFPHICARDSQTLLRDLHDPQELEFSTYEIPLVLSRRTHRRVESTYSPTLSIVNFYTISNHVDSRFSSVNSFAPLSSNPSPNLRYARPFSALSQMSSTMSYKNQSRSADGKRESSAGEYPPDSPKGCFRPLSLSLGPIGRVGVMSVSGTEREGNRSSWLSLAPGRHVIFGKGIDAKEDNDEEWEGLNLKTRAIKTSID